MTPPEGWRWRAGNGGSGGGGLNCPPNRPPYTAPRVSAVDIRLCRDKLQIMKQVMKWRLCQTQQRTFYSVHINSVIGHLQFIPIQIGSVTVFHSVIGQFTSFHTALPLVGSTTHQSLDAALLIYWLRRSLITVRVDLKRHHHCLASECKQATPLTQYLAILTGDKLQIAEANMSPKNEVEDMTNRHRQFALSSTTEMI